MSLRVARILVLGVLSAALPQALQAQAAGQWACRADSLAGFNCAHYYSGTVTLTSELTGSVHQTRKIVATVTGGRVACRVSGSEVTEFEAPGMVAVVHEATLTAGGGYSISVWCPEEAGDRPHRGTEPQIKIEGQRAATYATLEGKDSHEHPEADAANGISGTETITWSLRRS
jgi:hypothetical protein